MKRKTLSGHNHWVLCCAISPDNKLIVSCSRDNNLILWDRDGNRIRTLRGHGKIVTCCTFSDDSKFVISGSRDYEIRVWSTETGQETAVFGYLREHSARNQIVGCDTFGDRIVSVASKTLKLWTFDGKELRTFTGHDKLIINCKFSNSGKFIASASADNTVRIWSVTESKPLKTLRGHTDYIHSCSWSINDDLLASGSDDGSIRIWTICDGKCKMKLENSVPVHSVMFLSGADHILSGDYKGGLRLWDTSHQTIVKELKTHERKIECCAVDSQETFAVTASDDKTLCLIDLPAQLYRPGVDEIMDSMKVILVEFSKETLLEILEMLASKWRIVKFLEERKED